MAFDQRGGPTSREFLKSACFSALRRLRLSRDIESKILFFLPLSFQMTVLRICRTRTLIHLVANEPFETWHKAAVAAAAEQGNIGRNDGQRAAASQQSDTSQTKTRGQQNLGQAVNPPDGTQSEILSRRKRFWGRIKKGMRRSEKEKNGSNEAQKQDLKA